LFAVLSVAFAFNGGKELMVDAAVSDALWKIMLGIFANEFGTF
jgi:hypothetical protein